ncbi:hypothetical protein CW304_24695 [Bacillus sp. UFRGS-B20]|nr:hypothetical protein CW304_24695 [Bacillus sp. UFRGS-B20]
MSNNEAWIVAERYSRLLYVHLVNLLAVLVLHKIPGPSCKAESFRQVDLVTRLIFPPSYAYYTYSCETGKILLLPQIQFLLLLILIFSPYLFSQRLPVHYPS